MKVVRTIESVRDAVRFARGEHKRVGFVPTMGALHKGHAFLIETARGQCDFVVVSIFVNPTQFGPGEDFERYPRPLEKDLEVCKQTGVDVVFVPSAGQMYGAGSLTWVNVEKLTEPLCGRFRPGHFRGVATVCAKLFNIVGADVAFFGQKDAQQTVVIKKMVEDLKMPLEIVVCPTVREADGLAVSSRNSYLDARQRKDAAVLYRALQKGSEMIAKGQGETGAIIAEMRKVISEAGSVQVEYVSIVDAETLKEAERICGKVLLAVAGTIGSTRLIDNIVVDTEKKRDIMPQERVCDFRS